MRDDILTTVITTVADIFERDPATLSGGTRLMTDLPCESIDLLEIASRLAYRCRVSVDDDALFLRSLRARVEQEAGEAPEAVIARACPWLREGRAAELAAGLGDPAPMVTLGDIADYLAALTGPRAV